jgi:hypothetical protein
LIRLWKEKKEEEKEKEEKKKKKQENKIFSPGRRKTDMESW